MLVHIAARVRKSQVARLLMARLFLVSCALCAPGVGANGHGHSPLQAGGERDVAVEGGAEKSPGSLDRVTVERYEIDIAFRPEKSFLHARAGVTLRVVLPRAPQAAKTLGAIEFELNPQLKILEVTDPAGHKLEFERSQRLGSPKLSVRLATAPEADQPFTLTFTYEGVLPVGPLDYITKDGILLRDESRWYPAVDLSAFTQNGITLHLPPGWMGITSGDWEGGHWKTSRPVSSRSLVAYPTNGRMCGGFGGGTVGEPYFSDWTCFTCEYAVLGSQLAGKTAGPQNFYTKLLGPNPHNRWIFAQGFPGQRGAIGYSAPGFLVVSEDILKYQDYPGYAPEFLPHEIAHQWFPIEVTLASEADGWLAESLAEYLAWRYLAETNPAEAQRMVARAMRDALAPEPLPLLSLGLRLFALESQEVTHATLYQRGMLVFRTLETVIDRERVDRALREYYKRYAGKSASIADFRKICEEISGRDLGWFFDYFLNGTRIPEIEIRRTASSVPGEVAGEIVIQNAPPEFQVRVEMRLETSGGPVEHSVATRGDVTPFTATTTQPATRLTLDPHQRILRWTEAARRNRSQRARLDPLGALERAGRLERAAEVCAQALALDPENLASNEQQIRFALGRLRYRQGRLAEAFAEFENVLALGSLDPLESDFDRAWSRVYRARIEKQRGHLARARAEAQAGLALKSPALATPVALPEATEPTTAAAELRRVFP